MNFLEFLVQVFKIISIDVILGFIIWLMYKYIDLKYFSTFEITTLKRENNYLKEQNKKFNGTSTFFDEEDKIWFHVYQVYQDKEKMFLPRI